MGLLLRDVRRVEHHRAAATYLLTRPDLLQAYAMQELPCSLGQGLELHVLECALAGRALRSSCRGHCPAYPGALTLPDNVFGPDAVAEGYLTEEEGEAEGGGIMLVS